MKDLTVGKTFKTLLLYAIPLVIAGIISQTYNLADLIIAGKFLGDDALSATGSTTTFIQFLSSLFWGCGVAISTRVGKLYGENNKKNIISSISTWIFFVTILMVVLCVICICFSDTILTLLKVDKEIYEASKLYFNIYVVSLFFQALHYQVTNIMQALGDSKYPMFLTIISGVSNIFLNIIFVTLFNMGVEGLALATIISCLISLIFGFIKTIKYIKEMGGKFEFKIYKEDFIPTFKLAIPCVLQQISLYISGVIVQPMINKLGKNYSGGYSLAMNVNLLFNAIYHAVSRTVLVYSAQSLGAKKYENFDKGVVDGYALQLLFYLPLAIFTFICPELVFSIFLRNKGSEVLANAIPYIYYCLPFVFFCAFGNLMHSFFKSVESTNVVLVTTLIFTIARIVSAVLLEGYGINGIYFSLSIAWIVEAFILLFAYFFIFKKKIKKLEAANL